MSEITIYHNPRCSKSRQTLELLQKNNISPEIILYLETPPSKEQLKSLLHKLNLSARELIRSSEEAFRQGGLADNKLTDDQLIDAMIAEPKLIQRPIVVSAAGAVLGRPPENILDII